METWQTCLFVFFFAIKYSTREYYFLCFCTSVHFLQVFKHFLVQNLVVKEDFKNHVKIDNLEKSLKKTPIDCFKLNERYEIFVWICCKLKLNSNETQFWKRILGYKLFYNTDFLIEL